MADIIRFLAYLGVSGIWFVFTLVVVAKLSTSATSRVSRIVLQEGTLVLALIGLLINVFVLTGFSSL